MNRAFKVIQGHPIGAGRNPEWSAVVMCN